MGYAALRKARELTQVELAERLGVTQASVAGLESRVDLQLSTLARYIRALGGELEVRAVWPDGDFNVLELPGIVPAAAGKPRSVSKVHTVRERKQAAG